MKIWAKTKEFFEGKFLVVRRDGSIPHWPHFVLGARDPAVPATLRYYALQCENFGYDKEYVDSIMDLANDFEAYRAAQGLGDPDAAPHRVDDPLIVDLMGGRVPAALVQLHRDQGNVLKPTPADPNASIVTRARALRISDEGQVGVPARLAARPDVDRLRKE